jgi:outer membrane immunogenic protein
MNRAALLASMAAGMTLLGGAAVAQTSPANDWSGPYIGLNAGYNWGSTSSHGSRTTVNQLSGVDAGAGPVSAPPTTFNTGRYRANGSGFMGGGQLGVNVQHNAFVWGLEGDFDAIDARGHQAATYSLGPTALTTGSTVIERHRADPHWVASVRGRVGVAADRALFYGTGGLAFADLRNRASYIYAPSVTSAVATANPGVTYGPYASGGGESGVHTGWTAGGGAEYLLSPNVTIGAEYRHTDIGTGTHTFGSSGPNGVSERARLGFTDDAVLGRINFKFGALGHWW